MATRARTLSVISDDIMKRNIEIKRLNALVKIEESARDLLDTEIIGVAEKQGLEVGGGAISKFKISESTVPQSGGDKWDLFYAYMAKNKYWHLLDKRLSVTGCRELWAMGKTIPGVEKFTKKKVTVTEL